MNSIIFCWVLIISSANDTACRQKFYEAALKDTIQMGAAYIKFTIVDSSGRKSVLWPNDNLYHFFKRNHGMSFDSYEEFMKGVLNGKQSISSSTFKTLPPYLTLRKNKYVERIAKKGKKALINHFFYSSVFKFKYQQHFEAVVAKLFDYGVLVATVDNGAQAIVYNADCF